MPVAFPPGGRVLHKPSPCEGARKCGMPVAFPLEGRKLKKAFPVLREGGPRQRWMRFKKETFIVNVT